MRHKNDIALAATSARSYNRHWRAKKLSWTDIGKIRYLFDGAIEYMDEVTLAYTHEHFNRLRKALGYKQDSELTELIERSEAFRIVRNIETQQMEAFMSPLVGDRYVLTPGQEIEEPAIPCELFFCKANALANDNDRDKISENQRQHLNGINMHVLLAGNVPKFHITPEDGALQRIYNGLISIRCNDYVNQRYFGDFIFHYMRRYKVDKEMADSVLDIYINGKLAGHMARRVGIENWPREAILKWLDYYFGAKQLEKVVTDAHQTWQRHLEGSLKEYASDLIKEINDKKKNEV
jgi:hypothetical protein